MSFDDIIAKVRAHPELWQSSHPFYRHRVVCARTWKEITAELKADETTVRKRWKHLKDQYRKEQKKILSKTIPMSFWQHYTDLHILSGELSRANIKPSGDAEATDSDKKSNSDSDDVPLQAKRLRKALTTPTVACARKPATGMHNLTTRSPDAGKLNLILNRVNVIEETIENKNQTTDDAKNSDSDYMFLLSLLPIMKKLTDIQKLQFRGKMNDWLLEIVTQNEYSDRLDYKPYLQNDYKMKDWIVVKKRWKHMKDTFRKEIKKVSLNQGKVSTWIHYNELHFLADEVTKKHKKAESDGSQSESETEKKPLKMKRLRKRIQSVPLVVPSLVDTTTTTHSSMKFKKIMRSLNNISKAMERSTNFSDEHLKNDTDYMFLLSLLPTMKNLSDLQRLNFRGKINNWLLSALMENQYSDECENKAYVHAQINDTNIKDCKVELEEK